LISCLHPIHPEITYLILNILNEYTMDEVKQEYRRQNVLEALDRFAEVNEEYS
jgi:hypothetical protein